MDNFFTQYWPNFAGTVTGGMVLSILFFWLKEWLFSLPRITGIWEAELMTDKTAYNPYGGLKLWYRVTLIQNGAVFTGVGELDREHSAEKGFLLHEKSGRRPLEIQGRIEKRFTKPDLINILWAEQGSRQFSNVFTLNVSGSKTRGGLWGKYASTAAKSKGHSAWSRIE